MLLLHRRARDTPAWGPNPASIQRLCFLLPAPGLEGRRGAGGAAPRRGLSAIIISEASMVVAGPSITLARRSARRSALLALLLCGGASSGRAGGAPRPGTGSVPALDNGLGATPGMGWNWDYCQGCKHPPGYAKGYGEEFIRHTAAFLKSSGLAAKGYHYVNTDSFWGLANRSASGDLQPDPHLWPSGLEATVKALHAMDLGFGLYGDRGTHECNGQRPGQLGFEEQDAEFFARMGIDWFKSDSCFASGSHDVALASCKIVILSRFACCPSH